MTRNVSPENRQKYDQVFMQIVLGVQAGAQATRPSAPGSLAQLFHKEQVADALQGCAALIAGWNGGAVDEAAVKKTAAALRGLGLPDLAGRVENLVDIDGLAGVRVGEKGAAGS